MTTRDVLSHLRPSLRLVAPLTYWISIGFGWVNILIWYLLSHISSTAVKTFGVPVANSPLVFNLWGYWFLIVGLGLLLALAMNKWSWVKRFLILGLVSKLVWAYGLLWMIVHGIPVFATFILWSFLAWVQAWTIVFFSPTIADAPHEVLPENERYRDAD